MDGLGNSQQFTIDDLQKNRVDKEKMRQTIYRTIYAKCLSQIKYNNDRLGITYCEYKVPSFVYGMPKYNLEQCICHLVYWLRHEGYDVRYVYPDFLIIRWDPPQSRSYERVKFRPLEVGVSRVNWVDKIEKTDDDDLGLLIKPKEPKGILKDVKEKRGKK